MYGYVVDFDDIIGENYREYIYPDGKIIKIVNVRRVRVNNDGSHSLYDAAKNYHSIPTGWVKMRRNPETLTKLKIGDYR